MLYAYTSCAITGPKVDWSAWGGKGEEEEESDADGLDRNCATDEGQKRTLRYEMAYLALEFPKEREGHPPTPHISAKKAPLWPGQKTHLPAESSAMTRYVKPPSEM